MADLTLNFNFMGQNSNTQLRSNAQSYDSTLREINAVTDRFARVIVEDVVYGMSGYALDSAARNLRRGIHDEVQSELDQLARTIGNALAITERAKGPQGKMQLHGGESQTAIKRGWARGSFDRRSTGIKWDPRNPQYVNWKQQNGMPRDWWRASDDLSGYLSRGSVYTDSFGPIRVTISRPRNQAGRLAGVGAGARVTSSGLRGPLVVERQIATVRVSALGRITAADLPSLRSENPAHAKPIGNNGGLSRMIENEDARAKLMTGAWKTGKQRYVLEPFMSFFLTRALPNAVWRRIERAPLIEAGVGRTR